MSLRKCNTDGSVTYHLGTTKHDLLDKAVDCPICITEIDSGSMACTHTPCTATYHASCLYTWVKGYPNNGAATCPMCRDIIEDPSHYTRRSPPTLTLLDRVLSHSDIWDFLWTTLYEFLDWDEFERLSGVRRTDFRHEDSPFLHFNNLKLVEPSLNVARLYEMRAVIPKVQDGHWGLRWYFSLDGSMVIKCVANSRRGKEGQELVHWCWVYYVGRVRPSDRSRRPGRITA